MVRWRPSLFFCALYLFVKTSNFISPCRARPSRAPRPRCRTCLGASSWKVLGLDRGSSKEAIRKRFRELAATEHPGPRPPGERAEADRRFTEITAAYQELMSGEVSDWRPEPVEIELEEPDGDSLVVVLAILLWLLVFVALAVGQDSLSWEGCRRNWEWWCYFKGN
eukprot:Skav201921  [mRNA]  locus=scaffold3992:247048:247545:+ [translate_table: standard]